MLWLLRYGEASFQLRALGECINDNKNTNVILLYLYILTARKLKEILTAVDVRKKHLKEDMYMKIGCLKGKK